MFQIRTAVAAAALPGVQAQIIRCLSDAGTALLRLCEDAPSVLQAMQSLRPDLLICDAQLPGMEGATLTRKVLCTHALPVRPTVILLRDACFPVFQAEEITAAGALLLEKPLEPEAYARARTIIADRGPVFSPKEQRRADALLDALGVPAHPGRDCLKAAALICAADERSRCALAGKLYPVAGRACGLNAAQAERAMRHVISLAWQSDKFENQYRIFADTIDAGRGQPTCSEMISRLADILRLEG